MLKPWQDLVTHRLMLRADAASSGGGGGGVRGRAGGQAAGLPVRLARWLEPDDPTVIRYDIVDEGIFLC